MKAVERKLNKAQLVTIWLLIISLVLATAYITLILVARKLASSNSGSTGSNTPEIMEGEGTYLNQLIAYPSIEEIQFTFLEVQNSKGKFGLSRYPDDLSSFIFHYYVDGQEGAVTYAPPITGAEGKFDYESLYAVETGDGYGQIYYLTYLCAALGAPYFNERIPLPTDSAERETLLREYGLTQSEATMVSFLYGKRDSKTGHIIEETEQARAVLIGGKALSGNGYYFMVSNESGDGFRDYVYYTSSEYFKYALVGFGEFVKGRLVAEGLDGESVYGPYLTTDFKKWTSTTYKEESDRIFSNEEVAYKNFENPNVIVNGGYKVSVDKGLEFVPTADDFSGYEIVENDRFSFDLEALKAHPDYTRIKNALVGKTVGSYAEEKIILTLVNELYNSANKRIDFGEGDSVGYEYSISKIEAVINDDGEITSGTVGETDTLLKVTYRYTVGGQTVQHDCHAVVDITGFASEDAAKFVGVTIGEELGSNAISIAIDYTNKNSLKLNEKYVLTGVTSIFDEYGDVANVITENTYVNIAYTITVGADENNKGVTHKGTTIIKLADIKDDDKLAGLKTVLLGKGRDVYDETIYDREFYYEHMRDFVTYEISEIESFTANELIVSFRFCNASKRDPYYGDTFFENTLSNEYKLYGLNAGSCESVVKLLGGIGTDSNSAVGLSGKTVAIGLTLENMEKYGLLAHKIYFEMPRGIFDASEGVDQNNDGLSDFDWVSTLGFNLYISDVKYDEDGITKIRYIGSDMYDVIAKVSAEGFEFLDYGFTEFWARKHIVMMDVLSLEGLKLEFNMEDLTGSYEFELKFEDVYGTYVGENFVVNDLQLPGYSPVSDYETVMVKASEDAFDTKFKQLNGSEWRDLTSVYTETLGGGKNTTYPQSKNNYGAAYFNTVYECLLLTRYFDTLTEEEQEIAFTKARILRMTLQVEDKEYYYTYDFYRLDDRRIMVSLYRSDADGNKIEVLGEVSNYYITTFAFKKLVNSYIGLLNGEHVDETVNYN